MLEVWLEEEGSLDSLSFEKYGARIASDLGLPFETPLQKEDVLKQVALTKSFRQQLDTPKMGRWFSWNACAEQQVKEYHIAKMVYEHHLSLRGHVSDPDVDGPGYKTLLAASKAKTARAELELLRKTCGGFRLAYTLMSSDLLMMAKVLQTVTRPCWSWYASQVRSVQTPVDGLRFSMRMAASWLEDKHLSDIVHVAFFDRFALDYMGVDGGAPALPRYIGEFALELLGHRAWSFAARHAVPPESYANVLHSDAVKAQSVADQLGQNWRLLMALENRAASLPAIAHFLKDISFGANAPIRLLVDGAGSAGSPLLRARSVACECLFPRRSRRAQGALSRRLWLLHMYFEADGNRYQSRQGRSLLRGLLETMPDSKVVEDVHHRVKTDKRANPNGLSLTLARSLRAFVRPNGVFVALEGQSRGRGPASARVKRRRAKHRPHPGLDPFQPRAVDEGRQPSLRGFEG